MKAKIHYRYNALKELFFISHEKYNISAILHESYFLRIYFFTYFYLSFREVIILLLHKLYCSISRRSKTNRLKKRLKLERVHILSL